MARHTHAPEPLWRPQTDVQAFLMGRQLDWVICSDCGKIGLISRYGRKPHSWLDRPEMKERAERWNAEQAARRALKSPTTDGA